MTFPPQPGAPQPFAQDGQGPQWAPPAATYPAPPVQPAWGPVAPLPVQQPLAPPHAQPYGFVPQPVLPMQYKDSTAAWLLWFFLGSFGAHHFYLGRTKWGVWYAVGFVASWLLSIVIIGVFGLIALFVLWIVDATKMTERLQQYNAHAYAVNRSLGIG